MSKLLQPEHDFLNYGLEVRYLQRNTTKRKEHDLLILILMTTTALPKISPEGPEED